MSLFPGFGEAFGKPQTNPDILANTAALTKRNEQFDLRQTQRAERLGIRDARRAEDVAFRNQQELTRTQNAANAAQNENQNFQQIERPEATTDPKTQSDGARRGTRRVRRGR